MTERLLAWFGEEARDLPWRRTRDPYGIWVSEIMLQQTQVKTVIPYWERWMRELPDVGSLAEATEARVLKLWEGLGYYRRARYLQAAARKVMERHSGVFPRAPEDILALPGIGRYTAGAIGSIAFNQPVPILDGNVIRVLTRWQALGGDPKGRELNGRLWKDASALVRAAGRSGHPSACSFLNQGLMELGATICTPRSPACTICPVAGSCCARRTGRVEEYPELAPRTAVTERAYVVVVARAADRYWARQRAAGGVNGGLWEFPAEESTGPMAEEGVEALARRIYGESPADLREIGVVRHSITRYRITQRVFLGALGRRPGGIEGGGEWRTVDELGGLAFTSAHRRILGWLRT